MKNGMTIISGNGDLLHIWVINSSETGRNLKTIAQEINVHLQVFQGTSAFKCKLVNVSCKFNQTVNSDKHYGFNFSEEKVCNYAVNYVLT